MLSGHFGQVKVVPEDLLCGEVFMEKPNSACRSLKRCMSRRESESLGLSRVETKYMRQAKSKENMSYAMCLMIESTTAFVSEPIAAKRLRKPSESENTATWRPRTMSKNQTSASRAPKPSMITEE